MTDSYKTSILEYAAPGVLETKAFIDGEYIDCVAKKRIVKYSSVTGEKLPEITACDSEDVEKAVQCAKKALTSSSWSNLQYRKECLLKLADLMETHLFELAAIDCYETGRAYQNFVCDSIPKAIEAIRYFAEAADKVYDKAVPSREDDFGLIMREPLGVVGIIAPWNDPLVVNAWKFSPALLMGNSVIIKPAEQASLSMIRISGLTKEAGIPSGVFNVLPGFGEDVGKAIALHKDISGVFFTGSTQTGKKIISYVGQSNIKKIGLECGGKSPYIVTSKCGRLKEAADVLARNVFYNQGQICSAPSRAIVDRTVMDEFIYYLKEASNRFCPKNPYDFNNKVGCVVSKEQYDKVMSYVEIGKNEAKNWFQAVPQEQSDLPQSACAILPTIFWGEKIDSVIAREEIFGPVLTVILSDNVDDAIRIANDTSYGLAGAVWTDDINEAYYTARSVKTGLFHINSYGNDDNSAPFGGVKESGLGKDKSVYAFDEYSYLKTIWLHFSR